MNFPDPDRTDEMRVALAIQIPSDVNEIERVVAQVTAQLETLDLGQRQLALAVPVALTEALSNAIVRANREDPEKHVEVRTLVDPSRVVLEVKDEGPGFDIDACTIDPTTPDQVTREDGRGLFLMRKLVDRVERLDANPHGSIIRLTLHRHAEGAR
jgi:anti-sigma regulatory factor (Ser/Thr protein kinase)